MNEKSKTLFYELSISCSLGSPDICIHFPPSLQLLSPKGLFSLQLFPLSYPFLIFFPPLVHSQLPLLGHVPVHCNAILRCSNRHPDSRSNKQNSRPPIQKPKARVGGHLKQHQTTTSTVDIQHDRNTRDVPHPYTYTHARTHAQRSGSNPIQPSPYV